MKLINFFISTAALTAGAVFSSSSSNTTTRPDAVGSSEVPTDYEADDESLVISSASSSATPQWQLITMTTPGPIFVAPSAARCTAEERAVWMGNQDFSRAYQQAAQRAWGDSVDTVTYLAPAFPQVSRLCLTCLGEATGCARENCWAQCILDQTGEMCRNCINENCIPEMLTCTGAANATELPMPPQPVAAPATPSTRVRPSRLPTIQVPPEAASSVSEHSPAVSGPGRLRAGTVDASWENDVPDEPERTRTVDANWENDVLDEPERTRGALDLSSVNIMSFSIVMAFIAALVGLILKAVS